MKTNIHSATNFSFIAFIFMLTLLLVSAQEVQAQQPLSPTKNDSLNAQLLKNLESSRAEMEHLRIADSIERYKLLEKIEQLTFADGEKRQELERQLEFQKVKQQSLLSSKKARIDSLRLFAKASVVHDLFNDTLFLIYGKIGSYSSNDRAHIIENRIKDLAINFEPERDTLTLVPYEGMIDIYFGESIIMTITENDALWNNTDVNNLATEYKTSIEKAFDFYKKETSLKSLLIEIGLALLVILVMTIFLYYLNKLFRYTAKLIYLQKDKRLKGISIRNFTLLDSKRQVSFFLSLNSFVKWIVILLVIYIALPVLFGIFPRTKQFTDTLFGYVLDPLTAIFSGLWNYFPKLITILVIVTVFHYFIKLIQFLKNEIANENLKIAGFYADWANPTFQIIKVVLYAFMLVLIFPYLPGSDSPIFKGVSVFLGVLFTFGSSGSLSNIISGLVLTYMRLFKLGDRVKIGDVFGDVIEKSLLVTRIRTPKNEIISIPNSTVMNSHTINYSSDSAENGLILHSTVTIGYDVPWRKMHEALIKAALRTNYILKEPAPFVLQTSLDDFYVSYQINAYTKDPNKQANIYSELHQHIQDCCYEAGIEILSPHYRAARDGNATAIPAEYLGKDYQAPSFQVNVKKES